MVMVLLKTLLVPMLAKVVVDALGKVVTYIKCIKWFIRTLLI